MPIQNEICQVVSVPILQVPLNKWRTDDVSNKIQGEGFTDEDDSEIRWRRKITSTFKGTKFTSLRTIIFYIQLVKCNYTLNWIKFTVLEDFVDIQDIIPAHSSLEILICNAI
jgi:hypothetical protein